MAKAKRTNIDFKIIWLSNILALRVPDEDYSRKVSCALNLIFLKFVLLSLGQ